MDIVEALLQLNRVAGDVDQPTDLQIGTVVKAPPDDDVLEISINTEMATLRQDILYLAEPVIEKKIPLLKHRHAMPHIHAGVHGSTGGPSEPYTGYSLLSGGADSSVQSENIKGWENGKVLSLSKDKKYIILNPALKAGDKVLLIDDFLADGEALATARDKGLPRYQVVQPEYNLYDRAKFEGALQDLPAEAAELFSHRLARGAADGGARLAGAPGLAAALAQTQETQSQTQGTSAQTDSQPEAGQSGGAATGGTAATTSTRPDRQSISSSAISVNPP